MSDKVSWQHTDMSHQEVRKKTVQLVNKKI